MPKIHLVITSKHLPYIKPKDSPLAVHLRVVSHNENIGLLEAEPGELISSALWPGG